MNENQIKDISILSSLASLEDLDLSYNQITDISALCGLENTKITLNGQKFTQKVNKKEIELPQIFIYAQDQESKFYTNEEIIYEKCTYNKDTDKIIIDEDIDEANENAKVIIGSEITSGFGSLHKILYGTVMTLEIDTIPPETTVNYSTKELTNKDVTVTITANEEIQEIEGWTISKDKKTLTKTYTKNTEAEGEKITVLDLAGNESNVNVVVTNIDKIAPETKVSYSTTEPTNQNVTVTITANELIQEVDGWTLSEDGKTLTKIYTENTEQSEIVKVKDLAGNESKEIKIEVTNIEKNGIIANVNYSTTNKTNQDVTVTITANKKIQKVEGWELSTDGKTLTKIFKQNDSEDVVLKDEAGNTKVIQVKVSNIDKVTPKASTSYSTKELTNQDVIVTITADKIIQAVESWTLSEDGRTLTKIYNQNGNEEVTILDLVGNSTTVKVSVENIDKTAPEIDINYSTTKTTNKDVTVTITANEEIQEVENWTLSEDRKKLTKVYNANSEEEVMVLDLVGNKAVAKVSIQNIEKEQNANGNNNTNNNNTTTTEKDNNKGEKDNTTAPTIIPKAGKSSIIIAFVAIIVIAIVLRNKNKKYRDII